jgi:hypothetical protein
LTTEVATAPPAAAARARPRIPEWARFLVRPQGLLLLSLGVAAVSLLGPTTPTYDPWAWIIWGREITELDLSTVGGPSWKPLPVLLTTPFALFGDAAPDLWVWVARAGGAFAVAMAFRVAWRLTGASGSPARRPASPIRAAVASSRYWGVMAGLIAALALLTSTGYLRAIVPGNSEGWLLALVLWAFERHLDGRRDHAFILASGAALLRPEVWPFLGLYALYLLWKDPPTRKVVIACGAAVVFLWFVPELWGSGNLLRAAERANQPNPGSPAFAESPALEVLRQWDLTIVWALPALALVAAGYAAARRQAAVLWLAGGTVAWLGLVAFMTEAGYAGNPRYLMVCTAAVCVLAGVGAARIAEGVEWLTRRVWVTAVRAVVSIAVIAGAVVVLYDPVIVDRQIEGFENDAQLTADLATVIERAGGREAIVACGQPFVGNYGVPNVAWHLHLHTIQVGINATPRGVVFFAERTPFMPKPPPHYRPVARAGKWTVSEACAAG